MRRERRPAASFISPSALPLPETARAPQTSRSASKIRSPDGAFHRQNLGLVASPDTAPAQPAMLPGSPEPPVRFVFASLFLVARIIAAWVAAIIVAAFLWSGLFHGMDEPPGWFFGLLAMLVMVSVLIS